MSPNPLVALNQIGQSVWYDNICRGLLVDGTLKSMVQSQEVRGVTSNPTIFEKAIAHTKDYANAFQSMKAASISPEEAYERLAIEDVRTAADLLLPVYQETEGVDGFISLEVSPQYAEDAERTLSEALRLFKTIERSNVMIKIPATQAALPAIREALVQGVPVNVTLLFSVERYRQVMEQYLLAMETRADRGLPLSPVSSVASFFVSRLDARVNPLLDAIAVADSSKTELVRGLRGKAAIANAKQAYQAFGEVFRSARFSRLRSLGARVQRPLWASTSVKDPAYPDLFYVEALVAPDSVNTIPTATLDAYRDHGAPSIRINDDLETLPSVFDGLAQLDISVEEIAKQLESEGVASFKKSFEDLLQAVQNGLSA